MKKFIVQIAGETAIDEQGIAGLIKLFFIIGHAGSNRPIPAVTVIQDELPPAVKLCNCRGNSLCPNCKGSGVIRETISRRHEHTH